MPQYTYQSGNQQLTTGSNDSPHSSHYYQSNHSLEDVSQQPNHETHVTINDGDDSDDEYQSEIDHQFYTPGALGRFTNNYCTPIANSLNYLCCHTLLFRGPLLVYFAGGRFLASAGIAFYINEQTLLTIHQLFFGTSNSAITPSWKIIIDSISAVGATCDFTMNSLTRFPSLVDLVIKKKLPTKDINFSTQAIPTTLALGVVTCVALYNAAVGIFPGNLFGVHKILHELNQRVNLPDNVYNVIDKTTSSLLALSAVINNLSYSQIKTLGNTAQSFSRLANFVKYYLCCGHQTDSNAHINNAGFQRQLPGTWLPSRSRLAQYGQYTFNAFVGVGGIVARQFVNYLTNKAALAHITTFSSLFGLDISLTPKSAFIQQLALYSLAPSFYSQFTAQAGTALRLTHNGVKELTQSFSMLPNKHKVTGSILGFMLFTYLVFSTLGAIKSTDEFYNDHLKDGLSSIYGTLDDPLNQITEIGLCAYMGIANFILAFYFEYYTAMRKFCDHFLTDQSSSTHVEEIDTHIVPQGESANQELPGSSNDQEELHLFEEQGLGYGSTEATVYEIGQDTYYYQPNTTNTSLANNSHTLYYPSSSSSAANQANHGQEPNADDDQEEENNIFTMQNQIQ